MIKILFFIETLGGGGAENVLCDLVNHMDQSRFDITVETLWPSENAKKLDEGIKYRSVYSSHSRLNQYRMRIESALGLVYRLHMKDDYDIEVAYLEMGSTKIVASSTNKKAKKIAWVHCDLALRVKQDLAVFVTDNTQYYKRFDRVVCVSEDSRRSFERLFGDTPPTVVLYNTVDDLAIKERAELPLPQDAVKRKTSVAAVGRLSRIKAYDRLLEAHRRLVSEGMEHDLWIVGEGEERENLEAFVNKHGIGDSVRFFGYRSNPYPFIKVADLLVCSSRSEGLSTFVTEGLILGKPIVTTDCSGMHELLGDSEFGLITENSEDGLYSGIKRLLSDSELLSEYALKAQKRGEAFSARELTRNTERFLEEIVSLR